MLRRLYAAVRGVGAREGQAQDLGGAVQEGRPELWGVGIRDHRRTRLRDPIRSQVLGCPGRFSGRVRARQLGRTEPLRLLLAATISDSGQGTGSRSSQSPLKYSPRRLQGQQHRQGQQEEG